MKRRQWDCSWMHSHIWHRKKELDGLKICNIPLVEHRQVTKTFICHEILLLDAKNNTEHLRVSSLTYSNSALALNLALGYVWPRRLSMLFFTSLVYFEVGLLFIKCKSNGYKLVLVKAIAGNIVGHNSTCVANYYLGLSTFSNGIDAE